ncbi:MAG TPA: ABC transporter ATP-binding protein [Tissierellaceae bacterium]|nr:ABC transporter ATP-binding protein [Tissierellaceae bacterium]
MIALETKDLTIKYGEKVALKNANIRIDKGEVVAVIGPNGSGKSTLIKGLSRCIKTSGGNIKLNNQDIRKIDSKLIAKEMAILPQLKDNHLDLEVETLVSFGRYPHLGFGKRLQKKDRDIVSWALEITGLIQYRTTRLDSLSGGERQRAWIAMALAQKPKILLLDEPTTYLDISYQLEILELIKGLNEEMNLTVVMVLHDINQAARYAHKIYVLKDGEVHDQGRPEEIVKDSLIKDVFNIDAKIYKDKINNCPYLVPLKLKEE